MWLDWPHLGNPDSSPHFGVLDFNHAFFLIRQHIHRFWGLGHGYLWEHHFAYHSTPITLLFQLLCSCSLHCLSKLRTRIASCMVFPGTFASQIDFSVLLTLLWVPVSTLRTCDTWLHLFLFRCLLLCLDLCGTPWIKGYVLFNILSQVLAQGLVLN